MMRRGPLADNPIETLLADAAAERINGILVIRSEVNGQIYLVDGDVYIAEVDGQPPLAERLVAAGLLTERQVEEHGVKSEEGIYLARALDTDVTIDEDAIDAYLLDISAATIARFIGSAEGEFDLDPYGAHSAGVLSSWPPATVLGRAEELREEAVRLEAERVEEEREEALRVEAERVEAERLEAERLAEALAEAERLEVVRVEAERVEAERVEAEELEAERVEAELTEAGEVDAEVPDGDVKLVSVDGEVSPDNVPTEVLPTEDELDDHAHRPPPPGADDEDDVLEDSSITDSADESDVPEEASPIPEVTADDLGVRPSVLFDAMAANSIPVEERTEGGLGELTASVLVIVPEEPPKGTEAVELRAVEWRVVVRAAQGDSLGTIADRLGLSLDETRTVVEGLWRRGLVATIGPGGPR